MIHIYGGRMCPQWKEFPQGGRGQGKRGSELEVREFTG